MTMTAIFCLKLSSFFITVLKPPFFCNCIELPLAANRVLMQGSSCASLALAGLPIRGLWIAPVVLSERNARSLNGHSLLLFHFWILTSYANPVWKRS